MLFELKTLKCFCCMLLMLAL